MFILLTLKREFPGTTTELVYHNPLELLIATILSAQTTDVQVNKVTSHLFRRFPGVVDFAMAKTEEIEGYIMTIGLFRSKASYIKRSCKLIIDKFDSKVPDTMEELITLPGVARKTANIVLCHGFGKEEGIAVDTHVKRLSNRLGLSDKNTADKIEKDLMAIIPRSDWGLFSDILILHGRAVCNARKPACNTCLLTKICPCYFHEYNQPSK